MTSLLINISVAIILGALFLQVRNIMVYSWRIKAIKITSDSMKKSTCVLWWDKWDKWNILDSYPSYDHMLWDLGVWTFNGAYPNLRERLKGESK